LEEKIFTMDTHNHVDVAMSQDEMPSPEADLKASMQQAGMDGIVMNFAVDYVAMGPNALRAIPRGLRPPTSAASAFWICSTTPTPTLLWATSIPTNLSMAA